MTIAILAYLVLINCIALLAMWVDKGQAKQRDARIPERSLILLALFGGSLGAILGMFAFRHKTRHLSFRLGLPLILAAQIILGLFLYLKLIR